MKVEMSVELVPWITPNFISIRSPERPRHEGFNELPKYALKDVDEQTLSTMCDNFRKEARRKTGAGNPDAPTATVCESSS